MAYTKRDGVLVIGSFVVGVAAGALAWGSLGPGRPVEDGTPRPTKAGDAETASLRAAVETMREQVAKLEQDNAALRDATHRDPVTLVEPDAAAEMAAPEVILAGDCDAAITAIDWALVGASTRDLVPLLQKLAEAIANGEEIPLDVVAEVQQLNGNLIKQAGIVVEHDVPGAGINGSYTHPAIAGNQIAATLAAAGLDLSAEQRTRLGELMSLYSTRDRNVRIDAGSNDFELETLMAEVDYKAEFYDRVEGMLGTDQVAALTNDAIDGRVRLGIYGPSIMLSQFARPVPIDGPDALAGYWNRQISDNLHLAPAQAEVADRIVRDWIERLPEGYWDQKGDALEQSGMLRSDRVREAARGQLELMRQLLAQLGDSISEDAKRELLASRGIHVPVPR